MTTAKKLKKVFVEVLDVPEDTDLDNLKLELTQTGGHGFLGDCFVFELNK